MGEGERGGRGDEAGRCVKWPAGDKGTSNNEGQVICRAHAQNGRLDLEDMQIELIYIITERKRRTCCANHLVTVIEVIT